MAIIDVYSGLPVLGEFSQVTGSPHANPSAAYDTWASEIGVSNSTTLHTFSAADDSILFGDIGFNVLQGGNNEDVLCSTDGFIALRRLPYDGGLSQGVTSISEISSGSPIGLSYAVTTVDSGQSIIVTAKYWNVDVAITQFKFQKAGTTAIIYSKHGYWDDTNTRVVETAYRLVPGKIDVVCLAPANEGQDANLYFQVLRQSEALGADTSKHYGGGGALEVNLSSLATYHFASADIALNGTVNTPITSTAFGTPFLASEPNTASSVTSSNFGVPLMPAKFVNSPVPSSSFGTPAKFIRTRHYEPVPRSTFGKPSAIGISQPCFAEGLHSSRFAKPRVFPPTAHIAKEWISSRFGTPTLASFRWRITYNQITRARPLRATQFGTPTSP